MRPHIEAGKLSALAISRADRLKTFPDVPTFKERGLDIVLTAWASIAMPAGTPPEIVNKMSAAIAETTRDPAVIKYYEENDFGNLGHLGSGEAEGVLHQRKRQVQKGDREGRRYSRLSVILTA